METINHECYVSLEVAKLLKEAGFDWEIKIFYYNNELGETMLGEAKNHNFSEQFISAPTLSVAQKWLREVKRTDIFIGIEDSNENQYFSLLFINKQENDDYYYVGNTYEEALEAGIKKALKLILKKWHRV